VPNKALLELMGEYFVYLVKDTVARDLNDSTKVRPVTIAVQKKVQLGQTIAPNVIIKSGIKANDVIVVEGVQSLHTGSLINTSKRPDKSVNSKRLAENSKQ
jgi:hypothetical protein